jgi:hypothetical protein
MDENYRADLIKIADVLARNAPLSAVDRKNYLARFRTYYRHLAATVETTVVDQNDNLGTTAGELEALK